MMCMGVHPCPAVAMQGSGTAAYISTATCKLHAPIGSTAKCACWSCGLPEINQHRRSLILTCSWLLALFDAG
jgi:hypothetical protein